MAHPDVRLPRMAPHQDLHGSLRETFSRERHCAACTEVDFVRDNDRCSHEVSGMKMCSAGSLSTLVEPSYTDE